MISIITAVHNQLAMNRLFERSLRSFSTLPYELIVIDNASTDGSGEWFRERGATVLRNERNLNYPTSQNQGIEAARFDWLVFMNNDVIVSPAWDQALVDSMNLNELDVATCCGVERIETKAASRALQRRWRAIKALLSLFGTNTANLERMHRWMYPDWAGFNRRRQQRFSGQVMNGFVGNTVAMRRSALGKIGLWDETQQGADHDLYLRVAKRRQMHGDIRDVHIVLDCFIHHYIRLTVNDKPMPFADAERLVPLAQKWSAADRELIAASRDWVRHRGTERLPV